MEDLSLTGAQKSHLRGLGQRMEATLQVGKSGLTPAFLAELERHLRSRELLKLRFVGFDRKERSGLCEQIERAGGCVCAGAVGHTALFFRPYPNPADRRVNLPS